MEGHMFEETELAYFERRAAEEGALADVTLDPAVRAVHLELAARYVEKAKAPSSDGTFSTQDR